MSSGKALKKYSKYISSENPLNFKTRTFTPDRNVYRIFKAITCIEYAISKKNDEKGTLVTSPRVLLFSGYKDGSVLKWDFSTRKLLARYHKKAVNSKNNSVLCVSASSDAKFLVSISLCVFTGEFQHVNFFF